MQGTERTPLLICFLIHLLYLVIRVYTPGLCTWAQAFSQDNTPARIHLPLTNGPPGSPLGKERGVMEALDPAGTQGIGGPRMPTL